MPTATAVGFFLGLGLAARAQEGQWPVRKAPAIFFGARPSAVRNRALGFKRFLDRASDRCGLDQKSTQRSKS